MEKVYYDSAYRHRIEATITAISDFKEGVGIALDKTIVYPGGGGQLADKAWIENIPVINIIRQNGHIFYMLAKQISLDKHSKIELKIDPEWRYYNMQQHSGQHLISAVLSGYDFQTVSVHLGEEYTLVEVNKNYIEDDLLARIENKCNEHIREAIPIYTFRTTKNEIYKYPLRKPAADHDNIRIVQIGELDYSACVGTHVKNTAEIGLIKILDLEKIRGRIRIKVKMGDRAYKYFEQLNTTNKSLTKILNTNELKLADRIKDLSDEKKQQNKNLNNLKKKYIIVLAENLINKNEREQVIFYESDNSEDIRDIAGEISNSHKKAAFITCKNRFCFSQPENCQIDFEVVTKNKKFGLKGGGKNSFFQGVFDPVYRADIISEIKKLTIKA